MATASTSKSSVVSSQSGQVGTGVTALQLLRQSGTDLRVWVAEGYPRREGGRLSRYIHFINRFRWPLAIFLIFCLFEPRATPDARLALGAAFFRAARFSRLRSALSSTCFVFILRLLCLRTSPQFSSIRVPEN